MAKKKREYTLAEYVAGVSLEEYLASLEAEEKRKENQKYDDDISSSKKEGFDVVKVFLEKYEEIFDSEIESKKYLYYHKLNELGEKAQNGDNEALMNIMAYALKNWAPQRMLKKSKAFETTFDRDDVVQTIIIAVLDAVRDYDKGTNKDFRNFAGYLKEWVESQIKSEARESAPIKFPKGKKITDEETGEEFFLNEKGQRCKITYIYIDGFTGEDDESSIDIQDTSDQYAEFEQREEDREFIQSLLSWPNQVGEVLIEYYGIRTPFDTKKTMAEVAEKTGLTLKQVRTRLEKGRKAFSNMYPQYSDLLNEEKTKTA